MKRKRRVKGKKWLELHVMKTREQDAICESAATAVDNVGVWALSSSDNNAFCLGVVYAAFGPSFSSPFSPSRGSRESDGNSVGIKL